MGIDVHSLALLAHASDVGVRFDRTIGIGRQAVFVDPPELAAFATLRGLPPLPAHDGAGPRYFEAMMQTWFAAGTVDAIDASPYEAAAFVHDMNVPWSAGDAVLGRYDAVLDFGCLEHVFDFPTAWRNCVALARVGGHVLHAVPMNNLAGHGFYQFSPELFFSLYRPERGFALEGMWLAMKAEPRFWWRIADPLQRRRRVTLRNAHESYLLVLAKKIGERPFVVPQQSDYAEIAWRGEAAAAARSDAAAQDGGQGRGRRLPARLLGASGVLPAARRLRERVRALSASGFQPAGPDYERVDIGELIGPGRRP